MQESSFSFHLLFILLGKATYLKIGTSRTPAPSIDLIQYYKVLNNLTLPEPYSYFQLFYPPFLQKSFNCNSSLQSSFFYTDFYIAGLHYLSLSNNCLH